MKKAAQSVFLVLLAAFLFWLFTKPRARQVDAPSQAMTPTPAKDFSFPDLSGKKIALSSFKGKVVLLDFWATWCGPCEAELPELIETFERNKAKGFTVVGVSMDEEPEAVKPFAKEKKIPYPVLISGGEPPEGYQIFGIPTAYLIDRDGRVVRQYLGPKNVEQLAADIEPYLLK
jgi:cytochrome c biogenesis protein CcmG, thiol:disulfide interchange protein DsbE